MKDYSKTLKTLIILDKLLKQDLISIKKSWGDEEIIKEINDELKKFISNRLDSMLKMDSALPMNPIGVVPTLVDIPPVVDTLVKKGFDSKAELKDRIEFIKKQEIEMKGKK